MEVRGRVGLGMRRLSIIDLDGSHQPLTNEDESITLVFNGEIYNYRGLRSALLAAGHQLATAGDAETIIHLYEDHGAGCVEHLRGMFAFALWDARAERLLLARDRFGIKPLYVVIESWGVAFASELKVLHQAGMTGAGLDWDELDTFFRLGYIPSPGTPFCQVRKLEPGQVLTWRPDGSVERKRYWDLPRHVTEPTDPVATLLEAFDASVQAHRISDVPVATFLSGGFDSSAVAASMALTGEPPHAFTARYAGSSDESTDESSLAAMLAARYGAKITMVDVEPDVTAILEPIVYAMDEPHADSSTVPSWILSERVAQEYKVAMAGTGGDELFAGYRRHRGLLWSERYARIPGPVRGLVRRGVDALPEPRGAGLTLHRLKRFVRSGAGRLPDRYFDLIDKTPVGNVPSIFNPEVDRDALPARARFRDLYEAGDSPEGLRAALYLDYKTYLPDEILHVADRMSMAHSLEVRVPFVDHELIESVYPMPDRFKLGWRHGKKLLRQAMRDRLPEPLFSAPKRGFVGPTAQWLRHELAEMLRDNLGSKRMTDMGYFNQAAVQILVDQHLRRVQNHEGALWALLVFSAWHRQFVERQPPAYRPAAVAASRLD